MENVFLRRRLRFFRNIFLLGGLAVLFFGLFAFSLVDSRRKLPRISISITEVKGSPVCKSGSSVCPVSPGLVLSPDSVIELADASQGVVLKASPTRLTWVITGPRHLYPAEFIEQAATHVSNDRRDDLRMSAALLKGSIPLLMLFALYLVLSYLRKIRLSYGYLYALGGLVFSAAAFKGLETLVPGGLHGSAAGAVFWGLNAIAVIPLALLMGRSAVIPEIEEQEDRTADLVFSGYEHLARNDHDAALRDFASAQKINPTMRTVSQMVSILELKKNDPEGFQLMLERRTKLMQEFRSYLGRRGGPAGRPELPE
jgi:hypothetical protein